MEDNEKTQDVTMTRWAWLAGFAFAAACFASAWPRTHTISSALYAAGFLAMGVRGFLRPVGSKRSTPGMPATTRVGMLLLDLMGPVLVLAGAWLQ